MIVVVSYYNKSSKNGGANRLHSFFDLLQRRGFKSLMLTYGYEELKSDKIINIEYWKNLRNYRLIICIIIRLLNLLGVTARDWQFYSAVINNIKKTKPKTVVLSYPTIDNLFLANKLSENTDIKVIFDYRDGITVHPLEKLNIFQRRRYERIERSISKRQNVQITAINKYILPRETMSNFTEILNFRNLDTIEKDQTFIYDQECRILHFGQLAKSYERSVDFLAQAIINLCEREPNTRFTFDFYGELTTRENTLLSDLEYKNLTVNKFSSTEVGLLTRYYHAALLIGVKNHPGYVSSKFFSYLTLNLPIFAAAKGNLVGEYIEKYNLGYVGDFDEDFLFNSLSYCKNKRFYTKNIDIFSEQYQHEKFLDLVN